MEDAAIFWLLVVCRHNIYIYQVCWCLITPGLQTVSLLPAICLSEIRPGPGWAARYHSYHTSH